jgi:threonine dehydrogenase-like Zn-dependent dehydrogenase
MEEFWVPGVERGALLVRAVALGVCATDRDIVAAKDGAPPPGHKRLIIGHESLGRVVEAPPDEAIAAGDLVVSIVRHPDPVPCANCAADEWDMCQNGDYTEHGIKSLDGFGSEFYRMAPKFVVKVDAVLGDLAVLTEPASVVAKAWEHVDRIGRRAVWTPRKVLVTGAGPVGLLAALLGVQRELEVHVLDRATDGPKPALVSDLGASFHNSTLRELPTDFDVVIECTGSSEMALGVVDHAAYDGIVCLLSVSEPGSTESVDIGALNRSLVLGNRVVFGSVNANRRHYDAALRALGAAPREWLRRLITCRVPLSDWRRAFERRKHDIKNVIDFQSDSN